MNVGLRPLNTLALCAGYGGLELGLGAALGHVGWEHRVAAYLEREAYAAALLAHRMEAGELAPAPIWTDLTTFDAGRWRGLVDCVTAGFPCQPHSHAGKREGTDDERWIWPAIAGIVRDSGAWLVVLENVAGLLTSGGLDECLGDLAEMGFAAEWGCLSAASVGASHERERIFIVGILMDDAARFPGRQRPGWERVFDGGTQDRSGVADAEGVTRRERLGQRQCKEAITGGQPRIEGHGGIVADTSRSDSERGGSAVTRPDGKSRLDMLDWAAEAYSRQGPAIPAGPTSSSSPPTSRPRLNPAFVCWLMGLPPWWTNIEHTSFDAVEMASYRCRLRSQLQSCLAGSGFEQEAA